jgi:hypothetical protein
MFFWGMFLMKRKIEYLIIIIFSLIFLTSCSNGAFFSDKSKNNKQINQKNIENEKLINELSEKYNANILSDDSFYFSYAIEAQEKLKENNVIVKKAYLNDIYRKNNKIYATFKKFGLRTLFFIIELNEEQKNSIINKTQSNYYNELSIILEVKEVMKPELVVDAIPISENEASYDIDFEKNNLIVSGTLIDFIYISENDYDGDINIYHFGDDSK